MGPSHIELVGTHQANEMLLLGKKFSASEALKANLLNEVFTEKGDQFTEKVALPPPTAHHHGASAHTNKQVFAIARQLASYPPEAVQLSKRVPQLLPPLAGLRPHSRGYGVVLYSS
jgi:enoyl-CoA hydratase/carnithine racemase